MRCARHLLRRLAAILRVVALLVMVPAFAQAHAGHAHANQPGAGHSGVGHVLKAAAQAGHADAAADRADCVGCQSCCCAHAFVAAAGGDDVRADRPNGRRVAMGPDAARPSAVRKALPEPPRPFA